MSFWSTMGNVFGTLGNVAGSVVSAIPGMDTVGKAITGASSAVGGASAAYENRKASENANAANMSINQQNLDFNKEQNELNRQFNASEAEKARQYNAEQSQLQFDRSAQFEKEMWQAQNEYNSPNAQVQRLINAGFNPNLFGGDNTSGSVGSAASSAASASPASSPVLGAPSSLGVNPVSIVNPAMEAAQIRLANAQANNIETNTDSERIRQKYIDAIQQGSIDLNNTLIHLNLENEKLSRYQAEKCLKDCEYLSTQIKLAEQSISNLKQELDNMKASGALTQKELDAFDVRLQSEIANRLADTAQKYGLINVSRKQCELLAQQITHQKIENGIVAIDFKSAFDTAPSNASATISANEKIQSAYDWRSGDWIRKIWGDDSKSLGRKIWQTGTSYGNWLMDGISFGANATMSNQGRTTKLIK